jgi:hypothetical protein
MRYEPEPARVGTILGLRFSIAMAFLPWLCWGALGVALDTCGLKGPGYHFGLALVFPMLSLCLFPGVVAVHFDWHPELCKSLEITDDTIA